MGKFLKISLLVILGIIILVALLIKFKPSYLMNLINPVELKSTTVLTKISKDKISADLKVGLSNNSFIEFVMDSLTYEFYMDSTKIAHGNIEVDKSFGRKEMDTLTIPVSIGMEKLTSILDSLAPTDSTLVGMRLINYIKLPILGTKPIDINLEKKIPAPKLPKIKIVNIQDLNLKDKSIAIALEIENQSVYEATILRFNSTIDFDELFAGNVKNNTKIILKAQDTTAFSATLNIDDLEPLKDGFKVFFNNNNGRSYTMDSQIKLQLEDGSHVDFEMVNMGKLLIDTKK